MTFIETKINNNLPISCIRYDDTCGKIIITTSQQHDEGETKKNRMGDRRRYSLSISGLLLSTVTVFFSGLPCLMDCSSWSRAWTGLPPFLDLPPNAGRAGGGGGPDRPAAAGGGGGGGGGGNGISFKGPRQQTLGRRRRSCDDCWWTAVAGAASLTGVGRT